MRVYPLGVVGIIGSIIAIRYIFRINYNKEEEDWNKETDNTHQKPHLMHLEVHNEAIFGKTLGTVNNFWDACLSVHEFGRRDTHPQSKYDSRKYDQLFVVCSENDADAITALSAKR